MNRIPKPGGVILAAGASRRMGQPKALLEFHGETFLARMVRIFASHCDPLVVIVAPGCEAWVRAAGSSARTVVNPQPERGMLSSLQCGLAAIGQTTSHILFTPMDLPALREETVAAVAAACERAAVVIPRVGETRGHPVSIDRVVAAELLALDAASGGAQPKQVLRRDDSRVLFLEIDDPGAIRDVDEPQDYQELLLSSPSLTNAETLS